MFEKVNPMHPDKVADRIAGAIVDLGYKKEEDPKIAVEVLIGHNECHIIVESNVNYNQKEISKIVNRIIGDVKVDFKLVKQDIHLSNNQSDKIRCGDNGIFKGVKTNTEEYSLALIARRIFEDFESDGKYILDHENNKLIVCQSNASSEELKKLLDNFGYDYTVNPLGDWTGGINVDSGATNRKLGSDMGRCVTGGGLHGKDLSKADVSVNIYAFLKAQETNKPVELCCAIGEKYIDGKPYEEIVEIAREYINNLGGFEKFAEWGLI